METTFCMIKPDAVERGLTGLMLAHLEKAGFQLKAARLTLIPRPLCEAFYSEHKDKPFFSSLVNFISSGQVFVMALSKEGAVQQLRDLMGHTDPSKAKPGSLRSLYGKSIEQNSIHGSDSSASAQRELPLFFGSFK